MLNLQKQKINNKNYKWFLIGFRILIVLTGVLFVIQGNANRLFDVFLTLITTYAVDYVYIIFKVKFTEKMNFAISVFIFLSMFLGKLMNFYSKVPNWDDFLHLTSGIILGMIAYMILLNIFKEEKFQVLDKKFITFFIIIFGIACAGFWEIFEFSGDMIFGLNSQGGSLLDTMTDIIDGTVGATAVAILYYFKPHILEDKDIE
ncbi:hypothetical protein SAMN05444401_2852 [Clostridium amylolyticum]|uniref:Membrane-spanning protein n=1 Tax=Clostridium amylolyticum TaxID=1121298 RepID=A0A1M6IJI7_9CLOT|nr:hypothetical protein [Clostridium amylolyticum]SHJ34604.1 hypothetical protein SAMN05444401_2852 [Clostridium amylolyticum]